MSCEEDDNKSDGSVFTFMEEEEGKEEEEDDDDEDELASACFAFFSFCLVSLSSISKLLLYSSKDFFEWGFRAKAWDELGFIGSALIPVFVNNATSYKHSYQTQNNLLLTVVHSLVEIFI